MAEPLMYEEIAALLGITTKQVYKIRAEALAKVEAELERRGIDPSDLFIDEVTTSPEAFDGAD